VLRRISRGLKFLKYPRSNPKKNSILNEFECLDLPVINSIPIYSVEELFKLSEVVALFNRSIIVRAKWSWETGTLEFVSSNSTVFWFVAKGDIFQNLAALTFFKDAKFRAALLQDGRISLTGWCEGWYYGAITDTILIKNQID